MRFTVSPDEGLSLVALESEPTLILELPWSRPAMGEEL